MSTCPTESTLRQLGAGVLGEFTYSHVEEHVEKCPACQEFLQVLVQGDLGGQAGELSPGEEPLPSVQGFVIERELGRGLNGIVYLAKDVALDRHVALKILAPTAESRRSDRAQWVSEAQAISRFRHPNIVRIHGVIEDSVRPVLVLEYVPGGTLNDRLTTPLAPQLAASVLESIAKAIAFIHKAGLVHLDIKPTNILVEGEPGCPVTAANVLISDFGIALSSAESAEAQSGYSPRGTPAYMSPEQTGVAGAEIGPAADVYALGALLYHMLTGRPPFQAASAAAIVDLVNTAKPVPPRSLNPRVPKDLAFICRKCLNKAPDQRYATADELVKDLACFTDGRRISDGPLISTERFLRWCGRRPAVASLSLGLLVLAFGSILGLSVLLHRSEVNRELAEARRVRAEVNEAAASQAVDSLSEWVNTVVKEPDILARYSRSTGIGLRQPKLLSFTGPTYSVNDLVDGRLGTDGSTVRIVLTVSVLRRSLAMIRLDQDRSEEAIFILKECQDHLERSIRRWPAAEVLRNELILTFFDAANVNLATPNLEEADACVNQAESLSAALPVDTFRSAAIVNCLNMRHWCISQSRLIGDAPAADQALQSAQRMLSSLSATEAALPDAQLMRALICEQAGARNEAVAILRGLARSRPNAAHPDLEKGVDRWLVEVTVQEILHAAAVGKSLDASRLEAEAVATIDSLHENARMVGMPDADFPAILCSVFQDFHSICSWKRRLGLLDQADEIVQRLVASAERMVVLQPESAAAHLTLARAYAQAAKQAWQRDDEKSAIRNMYHAVATARRAVDADPQWPEARREVASYEERLRKHDRDPNSQPPDE